MDDVTEVHSISIREAGGGFIANCSCGWKDAMPSEVREIAETRGKNHVALAFGINPTIKGDYRIAMPDARLTDAELAEFVRCAPHTYVRAEAVRQSAGERQEWVYAPLSVAVKAASELQAARQALAEAAAREQALRDRLAAYRPIVEQAVAWHDWQTDQEREELHALIEGLPDALYYEIVEDTPSPEAVAPASGSDGQREAGGGTGQDE